MEYEVSSRLQIGSGSKEEFEEKPFNGQTKLFDQRIRLVPRGAVESLTISDWSVGGSNPSTFVNSFFFYWLHSRWQDRGTTFDWTSCWIKFTTMVSVWVGEFQKSKDRVRKRVGRRTRPKVVKTTCSQLLQWAEKLLGLGTFFVRNPFETLTQIGSRASQLWWVLTRVYDVPFWYLPTFKAQPVSRITRMCTQLREKKRRQKKRRRKLT